MSDDQFESLKQYIDSRLSKFESNLRIDMQNTGTSISAGMQYGFRELSDKMDSGFVGIIDALDEIRKRLLEHYAIVDKRFEKLEKAA